MALMPAVPLLVFGNNQETGLVRPQETIKRYARPRASSMLSRRFVRQVLTLGADVKVRRFLCGGAFAFSICLWLGLVKCSPCGERVKQDKEGVGGAPCLEPPLLSERRFADEKLIPSTVSWLVRRITLFVSSLEF